jgi:hypothetical protein
MNRPTKKIAITVLIVSLVASISLLYPYQKATAKPFEECRTFITKNPPRSQSGVPVPIPDQNIVRICKLLVNYPSSPGTLMEMSFSKCIDVLTTQKSPLQAGDANFVCNNLHPPE